MELPIQRLAKSIIHRTVEAGQLTGRAIKHFLMTIEFLLEYVGILPQKESFFTVKELQRGIAIPRFQFGKIVKQLRKVHSK
jgi:hypothetical protein